MDPHTATNQRLWDELAPMHAASEYYDVESFLRGRDTLTDVEVAEVGEVRGKRLVHLMCHFGLDTLSWARRGATVTGVDFSEAAIALIDAGIRIEFLHEFPEPGGRLPAMFSVRGRATSPSGH